MVNPSFNNSSSKQCNEIVFKHRSAGFIPTIESLASSNPSRRLSQSGFSINFLYKCSNLWENLWENWEKDMKFSSETAKSCTNRMEFLVLLNT